MPAKVLAVIPARMDSSRFPGKVLYPFKGKPLLYHLWSRIIRSKQIDRLVIASDSTEVIEVADRFGAETLRTSSRHRTGSDRAAEAARKLRADIVLNIQADTFSLSASLLDRVIAKMKSNTSIEYATLARFCEELCERLRIPLTTIYVDVPSLAKEKKKGIEETAREFRYGTFYGLAEQLGCDRIATGHHADDQVETILLNFFRGTGRNGLLGIPPVRGLIIRPLIGLTKAEILQLLVKGKLSHCEDSSNRDSIYSRNFVRHKLLPLIRRNLNAKPERAILALADTLEVEDRFLEKIFEITRDDCLRITPGGKFILDLNKYAGYNKWLRRRLLRYCVQTACQNQYAPDKEVVDRVDRMTLERGPAVSLPMRVRAVVIDEGLLVYRVSHRQVSHAVPVNEKTELQWPRLRFSSRLTQPKRVQVTGKRRNERVQLDWDSLKPPLELRSIRSGDRFRPLGMKGRKKVGDCLTDRKIARELRDEILVMCDREGIFWLVGQQIDERVRINRNTRRILTIEYRVIQEA